MKYKAGDRVKIREWEDIVEEHGSNPDGYVEVPKGATIVPRMKEFCGKETEVSGKTAQGNYQLKVDNKKWYWPEYALLPIEEPQKEAPDVQKKYKLTTPDENAASLIRAMERYANAEKFPQVDVILAILGIEKVEEE